jgi:hypothetical protein
LASIERRASSMAVQPSGRAAKQQLLKSDAWLAEIAIDCGYADQGHFARVFTKHAGGSPGQWRRQNASGLINGANSPNHSFAVIALVKTRPYHPFKPAQTTLQWRAILDSSGSHRVRAIGIAA